MRSYRPTDTEDQNVIATYATIEEGERLSPQHFFAVRPDGLSFLVCVQQASECMELMRQFDRLYGATLVSRSSPIEKMVDKATGKQADDIQAFLRFVWNCIFLTVPPIKP